MVHVRWACEPLHIASCIHEYQRLMDDRRRASPVPVFDLDYEAMVGDIGDVSRELVAWRRPGVGPGMPGILQDPPARANGQRRPGTPADLSRLGGPMEKL